MDFKMMAFGKIADITQHQEWNTAGITTTDELKERLAAQYPALKDLNYMISVNKNIVHTNTPIPEQAEVALLPPFSGG